MYLDYAALWHDETFGLYFSQQHWGHLKHISEWNCNPPLYYYFLWIWEHLFGTSEFAVRMPAVLFSALSGGMIYLLCARNFSKACGWIAFLFYSVSNEMFFYAHEARPHAAVVFFVLVSSYFFLELIRKPGWLNTIALGVINFGILYLNYPASIVICIQVFVLVFCFNRSFLKFFAVSLAIALVLAALRFTYKTLVLLFAAEPNAPKSEFHQLGDALYRFFNGPDLFCIFLFAAVVVLIHMIRNKEWKALYQSQKPQLIYMWMAGFGATVICFLLGYVSSIFITDFIIFAAPFIYISLAWFLPQADVNIRYPLLALVIIFTLFSAMRIDFRTPKPMDYRGAMHLVKKLQGNTAPVLVETRDMEALFSYYYDRNVFNDFGNVQARLKEKKIFLVNTADEARAAETQNASRVILTQTFEHLNPDNAALEKYLAENFSQKVSTRFYKGVTITLYSK